MENAFSRREAFADRQPSGVIRNHHIRKRATHVDGNAVPHGASLSMRFTVISPQ
jgi:hypothetical protein